MGLGVYSYIIRGVDYDLPFVEMIKSVLPIADEVCILTHKTNEKYGGKDFNDGTLDILKSMESAESNLHIYAEEFDFNNPAIDGLSKAISRSKCKSKILMQIDSDEVLREQDYPKIESLKSNWKSNYGIITCGVINWFNGDYINLAAAGWAKERFSPNDGRITHGIPTELRVPESNGKYYRTNPGVTDGAGYIDSEGNRMEGNTFMCDPNNLPEDIHNPNSIYLHHYSWYSLPRKWAMKQTWHYFWGRLQGKYSSLEDYRIDLDGNRVNFWGAPKKSPPHSYIQAITDEVKRKGKKLVKAKNIDHPEIMREWVDRQIVYIPGRIFSKPIMKNIGVLPQR